MGGLVSAAVRTDARGSGGVLQGARMRNPAEMLAMLAEHGIDLNHVPGGWGAMVAMDVAGALGMTHRELGADLVLAKYTHSQTAYRSAKAGWKMAVGEKCLAERWDRQKNGTLFAMADYTLDEWIDPMRCRTCDGADVIIRQVKRTCPACEGSGRRVPSERSIARDLGLSKNGYRNGPWPARVDWCRYELQQIETRTLSRLAARLTGAQKQAQNSHDPFSSPEAPPLT